MSKIVVKVENVARLGDVMPAIRKIVAESRSFVGTQALEPAFPKTSRSARASIVRTERHGCQLGKTPCHTI